jgi:phosphocarrier protein HPr
MNAGAKDVASLDVTIVNKRGLHARASAKFVQMAETFPDVQISVSRGAETVGGLSIMGLMLLAAGPGSKVGLTAKGPRAKEALKALKRLIEDGFGEEE